MSKKSIPAQTTESTPHMYCGPNIPGVASPGLLITEIPPQLGAHLERCPALREFIIHPKDYTRIKQAIARQGSLAHTQYHQVLEYLRKGE